MKRYIATYHKTGTALMGKIVRQAGQQGLVEPWIMHETEEPESWNLAFQRHARLLYPGFETDKDKARYVIVVRDPRDLIISAAYYHCKADEEWLFRPEEKFDGLNYQEKIKSIPTMEEKFLFEMDHSSGGQIRMMMRLPFQAESLAITRLETLVTDYDMEEYTRLFKFLDFAGDDLKAMVDIAERNSLFSGNVKKSVHVRSGKPAQWKTEAEFTDKCVEKFNSLFPDAVEKLGYQTV